LAFTPASSMAAFTPASSFSSMGDALHENGRIAYA
jgi:hypothetical protein